MTALLQSHAGSVIELVGISGLIRRLCLPSRDLFLGGHQIHLWKARVDLVRDIVAGLDEPQQDGFLHASASSGMHWIGSEIVQFLS